MSVHDNRCDECHSKKAWPFIGDLTGIRVCLCRRCAGSAAQKLVRYCKGFDRDHPRPKKPKRPIKDSWGQYRCRKCEVEMIWQEGQIPFCTDCVPPGA